MGRDFLQNPGISGFFGTGFTLIKSDFLAILAIFSVRAFQGVQNIVIIDPEKSRDCSFKNPGILADVKSRDPGISGIPLGPGRDSA